MADKSGFLLKSRNPDILTSIANLSNDEVFTPPAFANQMLDTVAEAWAQANAGADIWADSAVTFLDPFTKSGVFLREITRRLSDGLEKEFPDVQQRIDHILSKQVFGVAITELTSLLARRSVYCSKWANGEHSIATEFKTPEGNIWFERTEHTWVGGKERVLTVDDGGNELERTVDGKCKFCGANQKEHSRGETAESHAYSLIHAEDKKSWLVTTFGEEMQFDVIVGNPPYQLDDGGYGTSAAPIYDKFVNQAKALEPRFLAMVIPARWFSGGKGLDDFRDKMLSDNRIRTIEDFADSSLVFPGVQIKGGVCHFLWDRENSGPCLVVNHHANAASTEATRPLLEKGSKVFIRYNEAVAIAWKVIRKESPDLGQNGPLKLEEHNSFLQLVSPRKPFGLDTTYKGEASKKPGSLVLYRNGGVSFVDPTVVTKSRHLIKTWKVFIPYAGSGSDSFPHSILGKPFVGGPGTVCSETYLCLGPFPDKAIAARVATYLASRFLRFLVLLHKPTQHATRSVYEFVPNQDFSRRWSDEELYTKYGISLEEIAFIESMIRPMELAGE